MPDGRCLALSMLTLSSLLSRSLALPKKPPKATSDYPYTKLVVFGDQFADDGSGSWFHGLDPNNLFGEHTWTDGPVAPTYLAELLNVPSVNYAWGGANGNGLAGSTLSNDYTEAIDYYNGNPVPSTQDQIYNNYTANGAPDDISTSLQLIWVGQNDMKKHTNWAQTPASLITPTNPFNEKFYGNYTYYLQDQAEHLIQLGAPAVIVFNLLPYQTTPINNYLFCQNATVCSRNWGNVIVEANNRLKAALASSQYADKIIYYDLYSFMTNVMENKNSAPWNYTENLDFFCNGNSSEPEWKWPQCTQKPLWTYARPFFWFTLSNMETSMHQFIAQNVQSVLDAFLKN